jgi:hypothetical protein
MGNTTVQSEQIEDGSITAAKLADGTIVAAELADNAVVTAAINADAVTGAKIADNAIDSEHYTDGSIDTAHIADAQITVGKMAANSVDSDQYVDGSIDTVHIADAQVTTAKITDGNISTGKIADNAVTSAKIDTNIDIAGTFDVTGATTLDSTLAVAGVLTANAGVVVDNFTLDGTTLALSSGSMTLDAASQIVLDADGGLIQLKDDGTEFAQLKNSSTDLQIISIAQDKDIIFRGNDGGSFINALTLDMSDKGSALFNDKVGIGTTSPTKPLHVVATSGYPIARFQEDGASLYSTLYIENANSTAATVVVGTGGGSVGNSAWANNAVFGTTSNANVVLLQNDTERMRIDSSGNLLVGATSGSAHTISKSTANGGILEIINSSTTAPSGTAFKFSHQNPNDGTSTFFTTADSSAYRGGWLSNGGVQNYQANNSNLSDRREKTNFNPAKSYLDIICGIPVQTFNYIDQNMEDDDSPSLGVVAQDVQATAPELVVESNWGTKDVPKMRLSIYQTDLQYALMKCIQEQQTIIEAQTTSINDLKTRIEALES